jgi:hypothetical protein
MDAANVKFLKLKRRACTNFLAEAACGNKVQLRQLVKVLTVRLCRMHIAEISGQF